jgi:hypothetical protein
MIFYRFVVMVIHYAYGGRVMVYDNGTIVYRPAKMGKYSVEQSDTAYF